VDCDFEQLYVSIDTEAGICLIYIPNSKKKTHCHGKFRMRHMHTAA